LLTSLKIKNIIEGMKKILLLIVSCASLIGCSTYDSTITRTTYVEETFSGPRTSSWAPVPIPLPPPTVLYFSSRTRDQIQVDLAERQIQAAQMNEYVSRAYGPGNRYSKALLDYQNRNREINAGIQNQQHGFFKERIYYRQ